MAAIRSIMLVAALALVLSLCSAAQAEKQPVPPRDSQRAAAERIQSVYAEEYKSSARQVQAKLAADLLELGYREAVRFASQGGDAVTALQATDIMAEEFAINPTAVKAYALSNLSKVTLPKDQAIAAADGCARLVHELIAANNFPQAEKVVGYTLTSLRKVHDPQRIAALREFGDSIEDVARE